MRGRTERGTARASKLPWPPPARRTPSQGPRQASVPLLPAVQINLFEGTCYLTPLLGAWLADSLWGRYKTIMVFSIIYFLVSLLWGGWVWVGLGGCWEPGGLLT